MDSNPVVTVPAAQEERPTQREGWCYVCSVVRDGLAVSVSLHKTESEAVKEARRCGQEYFSHHTDDIVVFELNSDGICIDKVYDFGMDPESGPAP